MSEFVKQLNKEQSQAATHTEGPLLVVAGAGTGKTTVLIERLNYLIMNKFAKPDEILITTFTEKAAGEMEERADKILPYGYVDLWINTFHGFCERILRDHALDIGLPADFKLLTQTEQWMVIRKHLDEFDLDYYRPLGNPTKFIHELIKHFSRLKDENISAEEYLKCVEDLMMNNSVIAREQKRSRQSRVSNSDEIPDQVRDDSEGVCDDSEVEKNRINELASAYRKYNQLLLDNSYLDFGDLITYTIKLFKERPNILKIYQEKFKYIMVDEFQDTNWSQYELIKMLAEPKNNLMVTGDDDQAIYKFRGASLSNIMQFKDDYPNTKEVVITKNYRSGQEILDASYDFIKHNDPNRLEVKLGIDKKLTSPLKKKGEISNINYNTEAEETSGVVKEILDIYNKEKESKWSDFAILVRANSTAVKFVNELDRSGIPNQFVSLRGLYQKPIIVDVVSYLKLLDNYHESSALYRVLNMSVFKVEHSDIVAINKFARRKVWSTFEALKNINMVSGVSEMSRANIKKLLDFIDKHSDRVKKELPSKIFVNFVRDTGLLKGLDQNKDRDIFAYLNQFYEKIKNFESEGEDLRLSDFMTMFEMELESGETGSLRSMTDDMEVVKVMTVHAAKGLEFDYVFMPGLVDKKFPVIKRTEKISIPEKLVREKLPEGDIHTEEERRLFYVAITRAKKKLYITTAKDYGGAREKKPSKFLEELNIDSNSQTSNLKPQTSSNDLLNEINSKPKPKQKAIEVKYVLPKIFSFSQLEAYSNCPLQYKFNFLLKIPVEDKASFIFGRVMHNTLKDFFDRIIDGNGLQPSLFLPTCHSDSPAGGEESCNKRNQRYSSAPLCSVSNDIVKKPTLEDLLSVYKKRWNNNGYHSVSEREKYKKKGWDILHEFYKNLNNEGWPRTLFTEKGFNVRIGGYTLRGSIDRIDRLEDGTIEIVDYKTGGPKEKLDAKSKRQLILYKIATEQVFELKVSKLSYYYLEDNSKISFEAKDKEIEKLENEIVEQIEEIKKCNFTAIPGFLCSYCDFKDICEFRKN